MSSPHSAHFESRLRTMKTTISDFSPFFSPVSLAGIDRELTTGMRGASSGATGHAGRGNPHPSYPECAIPPSSELRPALRGETREKGGGIATVGEEAVEEAVEVRGEWGVVGVPVAAVGGPPLRAGG